MSDHADVIQQALDALDEASHGWSDDNPYMRAHAAAVPALRALVAERDEARRERDNAVEMGQKWLALAADDTTRAEAAEAENARLREVIGAKNELLVAYRTGNHRKADRALAKLESLSASEREEGT